MRSFAIALFTFMICALATLSYAQTNVHEAEWNTFQMSLEIKVVTTWQLVNNYELPKGVAINTVASDDEVKVYAALTDRKGGTHVYPFFTFKKENFEAPDDNKEFRELAKRFRELRASSLTQRDFLITEEQENVVWTKDDNTLIDRLDDLILNATMESDVLDRMTNADPFTGIITRPLFKDGKKQIAVMAIFKNRWKVHDELFITSYPLEGSTPDAFQTFLMELPTSIIRFRRSMHNFFDPFVKCA